MKKDWIELNNRIESCSLCSRLTDWREYVSTKKTRRYIDNQYWGKPVIGFGDARAKVLVLGLAPGAHGSNRTGRMFTGDSSGDFLYPALFRAGFANQPNSSDMSDGLKLKDIFITSVCRCVPPKNKPTADEIENCRPFLQKEIDLLPDLQGVVALGKIAFDQALRIIFRNNSIILEERQFKHGRLIHPVDSSQPWLLASYHPSRQNTQTGRLDTDMFNHIWDLTRDLISKAM